MQPFTNDTEILQDLKQGEVYAFDHVYHLYYQQICFFAESIVGNSALAEDLATESFVKILQKKPDFNSIQQIRSYLYTATRNSCLDYIKAQRRHEKSHQELKLRNQISEQTIEELIISAEVVKYVYLAINNLPERYRSVIKLALIEGLSNEEIVASTGMAYQTVRNHKHQGIRLLRTELLNNKSIGALFMLHILTYLTHRGF